jgi:hypothetical protein
VPSSKEIVCPGDATESAADNWAAVETFTVVPVGLDVGAVLVPVGLDVGAVLVPVGLDVGAVLVPVGLDVGAVLVPVGLDVGAVLVSAMAASSTSIHPVLDRDGPKLNAVAPAGTAAVVNDIWRQELLEPHRGLCAHQCHAPPESR